MDYRLSFLFFLAIALVGCGPSKHVAYHSTASVPYYTSSTSTQMTLVKKGGEESAMGRGYVIFVATDNRQESYILLAPEREQPAGYSFEAANLVRAVPLKGAQVTELTEGLGRTLDIWGNDEKEEGVFYEFLHAPEQDIDLVSPNVVEWSASVRFTASHTPDGSSARLLLGDSPKEALQYVIEFDKRTEVSVLRDLLQKARDRVQGK